MTRPGGDPSASPLRGRVVRSRRVFEGRVVSVRLDEVEFPSGRRHVYEIVEHRGAVAIVPVTDDGRVLMVRQFRRGPGVELLEIPAGTMEIGETPEACARRELAEEVGREAGRWDRLLTYYPSPGVMSEQIHLYLARDLRPVQAEREEEDLRVEALPLDDLRARIAAGAIEDSKAIIGLSLAWNHLGR